MLKTRDVPYVYSRDGFTISLDVFLRTSEGTTAALGLLYLFALNLLMQPELNQRI
jgi:hypothetical protein